jgi:hypothetical protein
MLRKYRLYIVDNNISISTSSTFTSILHLFSFILEICGAKRTCEERITRNNIYK